MKNSDILDYLYECRWCNFKEDIRRGNVSNISLESKAFDGGNKLFCVGKAETADGKTSYFSMPLARKGAILPDRQVLVLDGEIYADAALEPDFWQSFNRFLAENNGEVKFESGLKLKYMPFSNSKLPEGIEAAESKALGVEQSNTTLNVGDGTAAFKLERMLEFDYEINSEFEMNEKLMREGAEVMPKTFGGFVWEMPDGKTASAGIVQEYVKNRGDMWGWCLDYLEKRLQVNYLRQINLSAENSPEFMELMAKLNKKTEEMGACLAKEDANPNFTPEPANEFFAHKYKKQLEVLLYQTRHNIELNMERLPEPARSQAEGLLSNWEEVTGAFVDKRMNRIRELNGKSGTLNRVHGDFHLGQVMVTDDYDLKFIDFAGEPALPMAQRKEKHINVRDIAGMYRSIAGYLGAVAVENFAAKAPDAATAGVRKQWAEKAVKPLIGSASARFLGERGLDDPWLSLEILRKNLYEVNYEVSNRPSMAYVPIGGLSALLNTGDGGKTRSATFENGEAMGF